MYFSKKIFSLSYKKKKLNKILSLFLKFTELRKDRVFFGRCRRTYVLKDVIWGLKNVSFKKEYLDRLSNT